MKLFGQLIRTVVNVAALPVDAVRDVGDLMTGDYFIDDSHIAERIQQLKDEAQEDDDD